MQVGPSCATNTCHFLKYCNLWKEVFKRKCYQEPLASFIEVGHFGCFDVNIIMRDRGREYGLEENTWVMAQHEESENSDIDLHIVKNLKLPYIHLRNDVIWSSILCKNLRSSRPVIWKLVVDVVHHIERHEKETQSSNEMKVGLSKRSTHS